MGRVIENNLIKRGDSKGGAARGFWTTGGKTMVGGISGA